MLTLLETQTIILQEFEKQTYFAREYYTNIRLANRINGIVGARGTGKTTFLLKSVLNNGAKNQKALYVSADNLFFLNHSLIDLVDWLYKETDINFLCIDEVHKYPNWNQELKNIYDIYSSINILFSGSSMIDLVSSKYDLSRRVTLYSMIGFSFREYLEYYYMINIPKLSFSDIITHHLKIALEINEPKLLKYFREYLRIGYYPHLRSLEFDRERYQAVENAVQKTIYEDIGTLHNLKTPSLFLIEKLYKFVLNSPAGELSVTKLSNQLGKDFDTMSKFLSFLNQAGLVHFIYPNKSGYAHIRNPVKILPENTNMIYAHELPQRSAATLGKIRETFLLNQLRNANYKVFYSTIGDFQVDEYTFEVGGKNKSKSQLKNTSAGYVIADDIVIGKLNTIPLYLFGFLY